MDEQQQQQHTYEDIYDDMERLGLEEHDDLWEEMLDLMFIKKEGGSGVGSVGGVRE